MTNVQNAELTKKTVKKSTSLAKNPLTTPKFNGKIYTFSKDQIIWALEKARKGVLMKRKSAYENARIDILEFELSDIVTASNLGTEGEDSTDSGWTPGGW